MYSFIWSYTMYRTPKLLSASGKHVYYLIKKKLYLHMHAPHVHVCACCICVYVCIYTHILYRLYKYIFKCSCSTNIMYTCVWYLLLHRYQFNSYGTKLYSVVGLLCFLCFYSNVCPWIGVILLNLYLLVSKDGQNDLGLIFSDLLL